MIDIEKLLEECERIDKKYHVFTTICKDQPKKAKFAVSVKDCICVKGVESTAGSRILAGYKPSFDATCVERIKKEGGTILGKTTQDEFGFGSFNLNTYKIPKNPVFPGCVCGGSSGGAGALTSLLDHHIAIAESTGGSISCPAAFTKTIGFTPTYGVISRYGLISYAESLDKIGLIGRHVKEIEEIFAIIRGPDKKDQTCYGKVNKKKKIKKPKVGIIQEYLDVDEKILKDFWERVDKLEIEHETCHIKLTKPSVAAYYLIACAEASTNLARYSGMRYGHAKPLEGFFDDYFADVRDVFTEESKRRIILGTFARMAGFRDQYYIKALKVRSLIIQEFKKLFKKYDFLCAPTMPILPPKIKDVKKLKPIQVYMLDVLTIGPNLAGIPMVALPNKDSSIHLMADHLDDLTLLSFAQEVAKHG